MSAAKIPGAVAVAAVAASALISFGWLFVSWHDPVCTTAACMSVRAPTAEDHVGSVMFAFARPCAALFVAWLLRVGLQ